MADPSEHERSSRVVATLRESIGDAGPYLHLGMQLGMIVAVYTVGGYLLDRWFDMLPWLTLGGALLGMVTMFIHLVRVVTEMNRTTTRNHERRKREQQVGDNDSVNQ